MAYLWALRITFWAFNDGREADPFLPVRQHDVAILRRQLQGWRAIVAVITRSNRKSSGDDKML